MRLITFLFIGFLNLFSASAFADGQNVRAGAWDLTLPVEMPRLGSVGLNYRKEMGNPLHTLIFTVARTSAFDWGAAYKSLPDSEKNKAMALILASVAESTKQDFEEGYGRTFLLSINRISKDLLPRSSFCDGYAWHAVDKGVPGHLGKLFTMIGYSVFCVDYVAAADKFDFVSVGFSERFCAELGHRPLVGFRGMAEELFHSMEYQKGPPHNVPLDALAQAGADSTAHMTLPDPGALDLALLDAPMACPG
ncbi:MAG: hypothetical protein JXR14_10065 [Paracoccaceae bacterium]